MIEITTETKPALPAKPAEQSYHVRDGAYGVDWFSTGYCVFPYVYHLGGLTHVDFDKFATMFAEIARRLREASNGK